MQDPNNLNVYKEAYQLSLDIYKLQLPQNEHYELARQLRRASTSIVLNISEGAARTSPREFLQYINQANGSAQECKTIINLCKDLNYIDSTLFEQLSDKFDKIGRMLTKLAQSIREKNE